MSGGQVSTLSEEDIWHRVWGRGPLGGDLQWTAQGAHLGVGGTPNIPPWHSVKHGSQWESRPTTCMQGQSTHSLLTSPSPLYPRGTTSKGQGPPSALTTLLFTPSRGLLTGFSHMTHTTCLTSCLFLSCETALVSLNHGAPDRTQAGRGKSKASPPWQHPREAEIYIHTETCLWVFSAVWLTIAKGGTNPKRHGVEYHSAPKRRELITTWMDPENTKLSERSRHRKTHRVWFHWWETSRTGQSTDTGSGFLVVRGWGRGERWLRRTQFLLGWWKCSKIDWWCLYNCEYTKNHWIGHIKMKEL